MVGWATLGPKLNKLMLLNKYPRKEKKNITNIQENKKEKHKKYPRKKKHNKYKRKT